MRQILSAAMLALLAAPAMAALPPSLDRAALEACAPATIDAATSCLQRALSPEDAATLTGAPLGGGWRGEIDAVLIRAWRLDDAEAPLVRHMRSRDLYLDGRSAAGLVISNLFARLRGGTLDWAFFAAALRRPAVEIRVPVMATQEAPHDN